MDPERFKKNLEALKAMRFRVRMPEGFLEKVQNPDWVAEDDLSMEYSRSRQGFGVLKVVHEEGKTALNHPIDPYKQVNEALGELKVEQGDCYYLIGMGLGYLPKRIFETFGEDSRVIVLEPSLNAFRLAVQNEDLVDLFNQPTFFLGVKPEKICAYYLMNHAYEPTLITNMHRMVQPYVEMSEMSESKKAIESGVQDAIIMARINFNTAETSGTDLTRNLLRNLARGLHSASNLALEDGTFVGRPAIIIAPGPSLKKNVHLLKGLYDKALLLAVDTAYKPLTKAGVKPHVVCTIDPNAVNAEKFPEEGLPDDIIFYGCLESCYEVWQRSPKTRFAYLRDATHIPMMMPYIGPKGHSTSGGSVVTDAIVLANQIGCNPIVTVGLDLAYTGDSWYAEGSFRKDNTERHPPYLEVDAIGGGKVWTPLVYYSTLIWLDGQLAFVAKGTNLIDATEGGALKKLFKPMPLQEVIGAYMQEDWDPMGKLMGVWQRDTDYLHKYPPPGDLAEVVTMLEHIRDMCVKSRDLYQAMEDKLKSGGAHEVLALAHEAEALFEEIENTVKGAGILNTLIYPLLIRLAAIDTAGLEGGSKEKHLLYLESSRKFWEEMLELVEGETAFIKEEILDAFKEAQQKFLAGNAI